MKHCLLCILLYNSIFFGFSQNSSSIDFVIKNLGINVDGHFNSFSITAKFDNTKSKLECISATIKVSSIETGIESRDDHLLKEEYFNEEKYKEISLKSKTITKVSSTSYKVKADLKIKGVTKEIDIVVDVKKTKESYMISSSFEINRKDFDVGGGSFVMSKTVKINVIHYQKP